MQITKLSQCNTMQDVEKFKKHLSEVSSKWQRENKERKKEYDRMRYLSKKRDKLKVL